MYTILRVRLHMYVHTYVRVGQTSSVPSDMRQLPKLTQKLISYDQGCRSLIKYTPVLAGITAIGLPLVFYSSGSPA